MPPSFPLSMETLHTLRNLSRWYPWARGAHATEKDYPSSGNQVGMTTLTSAKLCPHSHWCDPLSHRVYHYILHGVQFFLALWGVARINLNENIPD